MELGQHAGPVRLPPLISYPHALSLRPYLARHITTGPHFWTVPPSNSQLAQVMHGPQGRYPYCTRYSHTRLQTLSSGIPHPRLIPASPLPRYISHLLGWLGCHLVALLITLCTLRAISTPQVQRLFVPMMATAVLHQRVLKPPWTAGVRGELKGSNDRWILTRRMVSGRRRTQSSLATTKPNFQPFSARPLSYYPRPSSVGTPGRLEFLPLYFPSREVETLGGASREIRFWTTEHRRKNKPEHSNPPSDNVHGVHEPGEGAGLASTWGRLRSLPTAGR